MKRPVRTCAVRLLRAAAAVACLLAPAAPALAAVTGSWHDFSATGPYGQKSIDKGGVCTSCHSAHFSPYLPGGWPRSMANEVLFYEQNGSSGANYLPGATLLCYDCHDDNVSADNDPANAVFTNSPQDIARSGAGVGYYENACGELPLAVNQAPTDGSPTGGHYWKSEPGLTPDYRRGDKIACSLCHDPHDTVTGTNEAFFRTATWDGAVMKPLNDFNSYGTNLLASTYNVTTLPNGSRKGTGNGRAMCAICHGYSDQGAQATLYNVTVPKPPGLGPGDPVRIVEHEKDDTPGAMACVACHGHNQIAGCNECHGYPPLVTTGEAGGTFLRGDPLRKDAESYAGGAGAHRRHKDALAAIGASIYNCDICHGPNPGRPATTWHNKNAANCGVVLQANVDIMGLRAYWDPSNTLTTGYVGGASGEALPAGYDFVAKGGGEQRCYGLTCHGGPPNLAGTANALNWTDDMVKGDIPENPTPTAEIQICKWCHDGTPARIGTGPWAPNVGGDGASWGADVNGHGLAAGNYEADGVGEAVRTGAPAANKQCAVCHDATYLGTLIAQMAARTHFDGANDSVQKRLQANVNGLPAPNADATCVNCHQNAGPDSSTARSQVSTHGNDFELAVPRNTFTRQCRQCHNVHGANWNGLSGAAPNLGRNLHMVGSWVDTNNNGIAEAGEEARLDSTAVDSTTSITNADLRAIFTANSVENSYDDGFNDGQHESVCVVCHKTANMDPTHPDNKVESTTLRGLGAHPVGDDCLQCHDHDYDNVVATTDGFAPSGCSGCHGTSLSITEPILNDPNAGNVPALRGQYWPDGDSPFPAYDYADNQTGTHRKHIEALAHQIFGETAAEIVTDVTPKNPTLTSFTKQKELCWFCHFDPGGTGHFNNSGNAPSGASRVEVFQSTAPRDYFGKFTASTAANRTLFGRTAYSRSTSASEIPSITSGGDLTGGVYNFTSGTCSNLVCHNQAATPAAWNAPPPWTASATCSTTTCHATGTYTNAHAIHVGSAQKNFACTECHDDNATLVPVTNPIPLGHGNGSVNMKWNNLGAIEAAKGGNGFYDKDGSGGAVPSLGDTAFAYKSVPYNRTCNLVYCHGGDNAAWGGGDITPVWDNTEGPIPLGVYCGSCHDGNGTASPNGDSSVAASGNHTDHLTAAYGPGFALAPGTLATSCTGTPTTGCHTAFDQSWAPVSFAPTHVNGTVEFDNIAAAPAASPLGTLAVATATATDTDRCSSCHSTAPVTVFDALGAVVGPTSGTALVKTQANWDNGAYELPCLSCHNGADPGSNFADGSNGAGNQDFAPNMLGTDLAGQSGAEIRGHGLTAGNYPVSNNPAANKYCTVCHNKAAAHLNNADDLTFAGNRMLTTIEGFALPVPSQTSTGVCESCHARVASPATKKNVNMHSNNGYPLPTATTQGRLEAIFTLPECVQCHDPHGLTANGTGYNIYMVPSTITVVPGATPTVVPNVRFEALTGDYSFNDLLGSGTDDLCVVCHVNGGNSLVNVTGDGRHYVNNDPLNPLTFYDGDERRRNCSGCHPHNRDNVTGNLPANMDGFMPVACNSCHTYPGLANLGAPTHLNSATHNLHAGDPVAGPLNNYAFRCRTCHYQNDHNESGMNPAPPVVWPATASANVDIRFDPARNGGSPTYAGANASTAPGAPGVGGTGACVALYCHGNGTNGTNGGNLAFPAGFRGTQIAPVWNVTADGNCGTCHEIASSPQPIGTVAHPTHVNPFANNGYAIGCQVCHYGTTTSGAAVPAASMPIHVNGSVEVSFNSLADLRVDGASVYNNGGNNALGAPYYDCSATYCHSPGTDLVAPYAEPPAAALDWDQTADCGSCHGNLAVNGMPGYAAGSPKANKHVEHVVTNAYACQVCHDPTTTTGTTITTPANHVNRVYNFDDDNANAVPEGTLDSFVPGSCSNIGCHGGTTALWTDPAIGCDVCHTNMNGVKTGVDVNNFAGRDWIQSKVSDAPGGEYAAFGHGAKGVACTGCHDVNATDHDLAMNGGNPYRLTAGFTCTNITTCHTGPNSRTVRTHSNTEMGLAGIAPQRTWPWVAQCVNCHDPHGDATNLTMVQRELYDKAPFPLTGAAPATPTVDTNQNLVFTDRATGLAAGSFAWTTNNLICQECHELAVGSGGLVSFHDDPGGGTVGANHPTNPGKCTDCHRHDAAFAPSGCEGCHNAAAYDPGGGRAVAPNVMGDGVLDNGDTLHVTPKPFDDGTYGYNVNGHGRDADTNAISHGAVINANCDACHNISVPTGKHLDGTLDGHTPAIGNANPFHLVPGFLNAAPTSEWAAQVTFDNYCWTACHNGRTSDMRHVTPSNISPAPNAVQMGTNEKTYNVPVTSPPLYMFLDQNIAWLGGYAGLPNFAVCVSCHNPHGTNVVSPRGDGNNKMMIYRWRQPSVLCAKCHI